MNRLDLIAEILLRNLPPEPVPQEAEHPQAAESKEAAAPAPRGRKKMRRVSK